MPNKEITAILRKIAIIYQLTDENRFKIIAYQKAADSIENSSFEVEDLWEKGQLFEISGVGKTIAGHLDELFRTGKVRHFESVLKKVPASIFPLLEVSGIGPKKAYRLITTFGLNNPQTVVEELLKLTQSGKIAVLDGFGERSEAEMKESLERFQVNRTKEKRILLSTASEIAADIVSYIKECGKVLKIEVLGSLRRRAETIGDIDIAVATSEGETVVKWFLGYSKAKQIIEQGQSGATVMLKEGIKVDLRVIERQRFGSMLQYFTGNKNHNVHLREYALKKGLSLSEYGIKPLKRIQSLKLKPQNYNLKLKIYEYPKEEEFYEALGLQWIPPELRENRGEIEAALLCQSTDQGKQRGLPKLVCLADIKGDLHLHSDYQIEPSHDLGSSSFVELLQTADSIGYEYIGISDHNPSYSKHSQSEICNILKRRKEYFEHIYYSLKSTRVKYILMLEVDILPDGTIPLSEKAIEHLDAFIVSIHSSFKMERKEMTDRVLKALSHPKAKILAHPTGRLINTRDGYPLDWDRIFEFVIKNNKALEVNSCPSRLDLSDIMVKECVQRGVKIVINTDSHDKSQMNYMKYGLDVARRGWATKSDIINTFDYEKLKIWLGS